MAKPKTVIIPLPFCEISEKGWGMWKQVEYLQRQRLYKKLEGLRFNDFDKPQLIINLDNSTGFIFARADKYDVTILCELYDEDWYVGNKTVEKYLKKQAN